MTAAPPAAATEVTLTAALPADATFLSLSTTQGACVRTGKGKKDGLVTCDLGALAPDAIAAVTIVVQPASGGPLSNTHDPDRGNNSDTR